MGRRVKKAVYAYGSGGWQLQKEILFVYDGWNLIHEKEVSGTGDPLFDKFYVWGLDLSQSLQGAGGIGGLVCRVSGGEVRHYFYDANGNVGQLVNPADGAVTARYEYDPFGNAGFVDGVDAAENAFRFSTKYWDKEANLVYYSFRFFAPELGRWVNREPLEESGGINIYSFLVNNTPNAIDILGLKKYVIGNSPPPPMYSLDKSSWGKWRRLSSEFKFEIIQIKLRARMEVLGGYMVGFYDAAKHLSHFLEGTGNTYTIRFNVMNLQSQSATKHLVKELNEALSASEYLGVNNENLEMVTSQESWAKNERGNWLYAVGDYRTWAKGKVWRCGDRFKLEWSFNFRDLYDWEMVAARGVFVHDYEMKKLHLFGVAREFEMEGEEKLTIEWKRGQRYELFFIPMGPLKLLD